MRLRRPRVFYGWLLVGVMFLAGAYSGGIGIWGFGLFARPMEDELGWSRSAFFAALSIRSLVAGALAPFVGPWLDTRHGPRTIMLAGAVLNGVSLGGLLWVHALWQFYLFFGVVGGLAVLGSGQTTAEVVLPKWFVRHRGRALGISGVGTPLAGIFMPAIILGLIGSIGWREAWLVLGMGGTAILFPLALLVRTTPEEMGLEPDGVRGGRSRAGGRARPQVQERSLTRHEAVRTRSFWVILVALALVGLVISGFQPNWLPYFQEVGFSAAAGATAIAVYGICAASARLIWGYLAERFDVRRLLVIETALAGLVVLLLINIRNTPMLYAYAVLQGLTLGGQFILQPVMVANFIGRAHLGAVRGIMRPFLTVAGASGPLVIALLHDAGGSYRWPFLFVMGCLLLAGAVYAMVGPPRAPAARAATEAPAKG